MSLSPPPPGTVPYFSMEIALESTIPTYSGGLGVLAGDTLRSAADLALPVIGFTLLHRNGYFAQKIAEQGNQREAAETWHPEDRLEEADARATVHIEGRVVHVRAFKYVI